VPCTVGIDHLSPAPCDRQRRTCHRTAPFGHRPGGTSEVTRGTSPRTGSTGDRNGATRRLTRRRGDRGGGRDEGNGATVCPDAGEERADRQDLSSIGWDNAADREDAESDRGVVWLDGEAVRCDREGVRSDRAAVRCVGPTKGVRPGVVGRARARDTGAGASKLQGGSAVAADRIGHRRGSVVDALRGVPVFLDNDEEAQDAIYNAEAGRRVEGVAGDLLAHGVDQGGRPPRDDRGNREAVGAATRFAERQATDRGGTGRVAAADAPILRAPAAAPHYVAPAHR
jgi:hypothetical protein